MSDNQHGTRPAAEPEEAVQAFEDLQRAVEKSSAELGAEMTIIRKGVEAAFERFETLQQVPDYGEDLGQILDNQVVIAEHLAALGRSPALKTNPEHYARLLQSVADEVSGNVGRVIESRSREFERAVGNLDGVVRLARERRSQDRWVVAASCGGIGLGILLTLFVPRLLPGSTDAAVASTIMNADRWNAGVRLIRSINPGEWQNLVDAMDLVRANHEKLAECAEAARASNHNQTCTVTVFTK
jgi:hypothetical protein